MAYSKKMTQISKFRA